MNKFSNRLTDCRSRLLDAEAMLLFLKNRENLETLLSGDSPEVYLGALIEKTWDLVATASGDCEALTEAGDEDLAAELHRTALELIADGSMVEFDKKAPAASSDSHTGPHDTEDASIESRDDLSFTGRDESKHRRLIHWIPQRAQAERNQWNAEFEMGKAMVDEVCRLQRVSEDGAFNAIRSAMTSPSWLGGVHGTESGFSDEIARLAIVGMRALKEGAETFEEGPIA